MLKFYFEIWRPDNYPYPYPFRYSWQWRRRYISQIDFQTKFSSSFKLLWSDFPPIWTHVVSTTSGHPTGVISWQTLFWNYEDIASNTIKEVRFKNLNLFRLSIICFNRLCVNRFLDMSLNDSFFLYFSFEWKHWWSPLYFF